MSRSMTRSTRRASTSRSLPVPVPAAETAAGLDCSPTAATYIDSERRLAMINDAAYFIAERRGFAPGYELDDWLAAEREIDETLAGAAQSKQP